MHRVEFRLCQCGVLPPHGRFFQGEETLQRCSPPFYSQERMREWVKKIFVPWIGGEIKSEGQQILWIRYLQFRATIPICSLAKTDQEAWDSLPEVTKTQIRDCYHKGFLAVEPQFLPGAVGQDSARELASLLGQNPPDDPNFKCDVRLLYAPLDRPGTLK